MNTKTLNLPVFLSTLFLILLFCVYGIFFTQDAILFLPQLKLWVIDSFSLLFTSTMLVVFVFMVLIFISPVGHFKLGKPTDSPEYSNFSWYAMLFIAGMGIGLVFNGVAEPILHFSNNTQHTLNLQLYLVLLLHWALGQVKLLLAYTVYLGLTTQPRYNYSLLYR